MELGQESELRIVACLHSQEDVSSINNIIKTLNPTISVQIDICLIHVIELVGRAHPIIMPHKLAKVRANKVPGSKNIINAFKFLQQSYEDGAIQLHPYTAISSYTSMHDEVYEMAATRRSSLIILPFHKTFTNDSLVECSKLGIKIMNNNILETAPCTTSILVNRAPTFDSKIDSHLHQVAIFFIGGLDDHEALALGPKMASQSYINLTIIRILENCEHVNNTIVGTREDNKAINQLRRQMRGNLRFYYQEMVVKDVTGTVGMMRLVENLVENQFELIIVGRHHDENSPLIHGLSEWIEESELGTVGDMFALADH